MILIPEEKKKFASNESIYECQDPIQNQVQKWSHAWPYSSWVHCNENKIAKNIILCQKPSKKIPMIENLIRQAYENNNKGWHNNQSFL